MSNSKYTRIEALERKLSWETSTLTMDEYTKWFLMFADKQGAGYVEGEPEYTPDDWLWFEKNESNFYQTSKELKQSKILI